MSNSQQWEEMVKTAYSTKIMSPQFHIKLMYKGRDLGFQILMEESP